ncbi:hypothetical protein SAMN05216167_119131 [Spirosoma endophyticum]|uniref:Uncharacterized protein n=1 Tax=Spirosoma endophyticum TaxID=662367 RepID=A0A1I2DHQ1_9BACT|nr:hypothetical protein SAMN05216167_119131 [Spirosoma endophyticum]
MRKLYLNITSTVWTLILVISTFILLTEFKAVLLLMQWFRK